MYLIASSYFHTLLLSFLFFVLISLFFVEKKRICVRVCVCLCLFSSFPFVQVHLKGEKVVGSDGPYRDFFADVCRELQPSASGASPFVSSLSSAVPPLTLTSGPSTPRAGLAASDEKQREAKESSSYGMPMPGGSPAPFMSPLSSSVQSSPTFGGLDSMELRRRSAHVSPDLLVQCPNGMLRMGLNREKFLLRPSQQSEEHLAMCR